METPLPKEFDNLLPYQVLIKVAVASFCHTDLQILEGDGPQVPGYLGPSGLAGSHEPSGVIVRLGTDAANKGEFKIGDRIAACGCTGVCETCEDCTKVDNGPSGIALNYAQHCAHLTGYAGVWGPHPGAFQGYTIVDYRFSVRIPDSMSFVTAAPLTCAGLTAFRALQVARSQSQPPLEKGDWIAVLGSGGGLGHLVVQFAKAVGLKVIGIDARDSGFELTRRAGADAVLDVRDGQAKLVESVSKIVSEGKSGSPTGVSSSIILAEHPAASANACAITKKHGTAVLVALPADGVVVPWPELVLRDIRLLGSNIGSPEDLRTLFTLFGDAKNGLFVETKVYEGLESLPEVIETYRKGSVAGKLVVKVDSSLN